MQEHTAKMHMRLPEILLAKIQARATQMRRSISAIVREVLEKEFPAPKGDNDAQSGD